MDERPVVLDLEGNLVDVEAMLDEAVRRRRSPQSEQEEWERQQFMDWLYSKAWRL